MAYYGYGGYPTPGGYFPPPPVPDQLAQLRQNQFQQPMVNQNMMQNQPAAPTMTPPANNMGGNSILWVSSEKEAMEYPVAANSAVALWDSMNPVVYLKQADASGKPSTDIYDLVKRQPVAAQNAAQGQNGPVVEYVTRKDFDALAARAAALEEELAALKSKPCKCKAKKEDAE